MPEGNGSEEQRMWVRGSEISQRRDQCDDDKGEWSLWISTMC